MYKAEYAPSDQPTAVRHSTCEQFGTHLAYGKAQAAIQPTNCIFVYTCCLPADFLRTTLDEPTPPRTLSYVPLEMANVDNVSCCSHHCICTAASCLRSFFLFSCDLQLHFAALCIEQQYPSPFVAMRSPCI
jgi:hypothetical protein